MERKKNLKDEIKDFAKQLLSGLDSLNIITRGETIDLLVLPRSFLEKGLILKDKENKKTYNVKVSIRKIMDMESVGIIYTEFDDIRKEKKELKLIVADDTIETEELRALFDEVKMKIRDVIRRTKELKENKAKNNRQKIIRL